MQGARRVLAVDVSAHEDKAPPGTERWREADLRKRALTLPDARAYAETGVDYISVGGLTHSVTALDLGLDILPT